MNRLAVAVYQSFGDDLPHWALFVGNLQKHGRVFEAILPESSNVEQKYRYNWRDVRMEQTKRVWEMPEIGRLRNFNLLELSDILKAAVPVINNGSWNCQDWVMAAINFLQDEKLAKVNPSATKDVKEAYDKSWDEFIRARGQHP